MLESVITRIYTDDVDLVNENIIYFKIKNKIIGHKRVRVLNQLFIL